MSSSSGYTRMSCFGTNPQFRVGHEVRIHSVCAGRGVLLGGGRFGVDLRGKLFDVIVFYVH